MPNNTIADNLQRLITAKNDIADAIVAKGGTVNEGYGLEDFATDIATIPNRYTSSDEGKVVYNGGLVAQTTATQTTNGTVDTTRIKSLTVNVPIGLSYINIRIGSLNSGNVILYVLSGTVCVYGTMIVPEGSYTVSLSQKPSSIGITANTRIQVRMYNGASSTGITMYLKPNSTTVYFDSSYAYTTQYFFGGTPWEFYGYK